MPRILRGLSSKVLACGCLLGIYETYEGSVIGLVDLKSAKCADTTHDGGTVIPASRFDRGGDTTAGHNG
jgi:hypothetical protein